LRLPLARLTRGLRVMLTSTQTATEMIKITTIDSRVSMGALERGMPAPVIMDWLVLRET